MAEAAGLSPERLSSIEEGAEPTLDELFAIATELGASMDGLLFGEARRN